MESRDRRRAAEREKQHCDILDVALQAFAAQGYEGTSMNDIARASGHSVGHIYNVVGNKTALFEAVMMREGNLLVQHVDVVIASHPDDPGAAIDALIDTVLSFFDDHREFFQIYVLLAGGIRTNVESVFSPAFAELKKKTDRKVNALFRGAAERGLTAKLSVADMHIAFAELINGFLVAWATGGYRGRINRKSMVIRHLLWNGIAGHEARRSRARS